MCAERRRARKGRPRQSIPEPLPDDLFDDADDPTPDDRTRAGNTPLLGPVSYTHLDVYKRQGASQSRRPS